MPTCGLWASTRRTSSPLVYATRMFTFMAREVPYNTNTDCHYHAFSTRGAVKNAQELIDTLKNNFGTVSMPWCSKYFAVKLCIKVVDFLEPAHLKLHMMRSSHPITAASQIMPDIWLRQDTNHEKETMNKLPATIYRKTCRRFDWHSVSVIFRLYLVTQGGFFLSAGNQDAGSGGLSVCSSLAAIQKLPGLQFVRQDWRRQIYGPLVSYVRQDLRIYQQVSGSGHIMGIGSAVWTVLLLSERNVSVY